MSTTTTTPTTTPTTAPRCGMCGAPATYLVEVDPYVTGADTTASNGAPAAYRCTDHTVSMSGAAHPITDPDDDGAAWLALPDTDPADALPTDDTARRTVVVRVMAPGAHRAVVAPGAHRAAVVAGAVATGAAVVLAVVLAAVVAVVVSVAPAGATMVEDPTRDTGAHRVSYVEHYRTDAGRPRFYVETADGAASGGLRPCRWEDDTRPCVWDAARRGNGRGRSYAVVTRNGDALTIRPRLMRRAYIDR